MDITNKKNENNKMNAPKINISLNLNDQNLMQW